jgi:hypothetical protein
MEVWWRAVLKYPATWVAIAAVIVAEWLFLAVLDPPFVIAVISAVLAGTAIVVWPLTMSVTGTLTRLQFAVPQLDDIDPDELAKLTAEFDELDDPRPAKQLAAIREKRDNLAEVLERRMDAGELTFARYVTTTQQVYLSALDNLHEVAVALKSVSAIDFEYIESRLTQLDDVTGEASDRERSSLESRRDLRLDQEKKIVELLAQNEAGMTAIDRTATALADAPIGRTPEDAEAAMAALTELAERASKYASG